MDKTGQIRGTSKRLPRHRRAILSRNRREGTPFMNRDAERIDCLRQADATATIAVEKKTRNEKREIVLFIDLSLIRLESISQRIY